MPSVADPSKLTLLLTEFPFSIRLLECKNEHGADASRHDHEQLLSLLPAPYRAESGDLAAAGRQVTAYVVKELDLQRLASIHGWLWVAGNLYRRFLCTTSSSSVGTSSRSAWICTSSGQQAGCTTSSNQCISVERAYDEEPCMGDSK